MNQNHESEAKWHEAQSGMLRARRIDPERLRKAIQYLGEHPAIPAGALTRIELPIDRYDMRTFECPSCDHSESLVVKFN
jgi:hypothetical protein